MHRKYIRATVDGVDIDVPISTLGALQFLYYNGEHITTAEIELPENIVSGVPPTLDNAIVRWDGTTGTIIQNSVVLISDVGQVTGVTALNTRDIAQWVDGPSIGGATDTAIALWDGTTGRLLRNSTVLVDETGNITGVNTINGNPIGTGDGNGDVVGPASALDNAITRYDGVTGKLIQSSLVLLSDVGAITGVTALNTRDIAQWVDGPTVGSTTLAHVAIWSGTDSRSIEDSGLHVNDIVRNNSAEVTTGHLAEFGDSTGRVLVDSGVIADHVVTNSGTSTDNAITRWNGTNGKVVQNSVVLISDTGQVTGVTALNTRDVAQWVDGPAIGSATDNAVARWDSTTGRLLQDSSVLIDDAGAITGVTTINGHDIGGWGDFVRGPTPAESVQYNLAIWSDTGGRDIIDGLLHVNDVVRTFEPEVITGHLPEYADSGGRELVDSGLISANIVSSPNTSTDNRIARYDGTTGKQIQQSAITIDDSGNMSGVGTINGSALASGDVVGPASATDNAVARFDSATGKLIQDSVVIVSDAGAVTGVTTLNGTNPANWVRGPSSAFDSDIALFSGSSGKAIYDSGVSIISGTMYGLTGLELSGNLNDRDPDTFVAGPASATDNAVARFDATTGKLIQNSAVVIDDSGNMTGVGTINGYTIGDAGTGDVTGPASSTHNVIACFNGTTGKAIYQGGSTVTLSGTTLSNVTVLSGRTVANFVSGPGSSVAGNLLSWNGTGGTSALDSGLGTFTVARNAAGFSNDNRLVRTDTALHSSGVQQSVITIDDSGNVSGVGDLTISGALNGRDPDELVRGPGGATNNRIARFDGTTGYLIKNSAVTIDDSGNISGSNLAVGIASSTDNRVVRFDSTGGKQLQQSAVTIDDSGNITGAGTYNTVNVATHATRHRPGGADSLFATSDWGDIYIHPEVAGDPMQPKYWSIGTASFAGSLTSTLVQVMSSSYVTRNRAANGFNGTIHAHAWFPYSLGDTGSDIIVQPGWSGMTATCMVTCGAQGAGSTVSGTNITLDNSNIGTNPQTIPGAGIIHVFWSAENVPQGAYVYVFMRSTGATHTLYLGGCELYEDAGN